MKTAFLGDFPQFFPQVWKTLVTDRTCMSVVGGWGKALRAKERDFNTKPRSFARTVIDTSGTAWLRLLVRRLEAWVAGGLNEGQAHIPAKYPSPKERAWVPGAHEHEKRPSGSETSSREGP